MEYRRMGNTGLLVSAVGLGTDQFGIRVDRETAARIIGVALDEGVNLIDTANAYGGGGISDLSGVGISEEYLGESVQGHRDEFVIATKGRARMGPGPNEEGASRYHLMQALEGSLRRLRTDHIDLYQIHSFDPRTPIEETMRTLDDMVRQGKVRYIGASNYAAWQLCRANDVAERYGWERFVTVQPHYHLLEREIERELVPYCRAFQIGILPYFPLAGGLLTGRYRAGQAPPADSRAAAYPVALGYLHLYATPRNMAIIDQLAHFAQQRGHALTKLAIAWLLAEPLVSSVITGVSTVQHLRSNTGASAWALSPEEVAAVRDIVKDSDTGLE